MNDYRAAGQELQSQVLAAARKGQERVHSTVKTVRAAADQIRPQLANLPKPNLQMPNLPRPTLLTPAQLRERAPEFVAKLPAQLQTRLPKPEQLRASAEELAGHARSVRRVVVSQVASVAVPLAQQAQQAASRLAAQIGEQANGKTSAASKPSTASKTSTASKPSTASKSAASSKRTTTRKPRTSGTANTGTTTKVSKVTVSSDSKPAGSAKAASSAKPKPKPADK
jgi:hypothetical protein